MWQLPIGPGVKAIHSAWLIACVGNVVMHQHVTRWD
jgi:hypothetical protein